jgi:hypothetical protein
VRHCGWTVDDDIAAIAVSGHYGAMLSRTLPVIARRALLGFMTAGAATLLTGCGWRSGALRFRLNVEIDTPVGVKSGSSVIELVAHPPSLLELPDKFSVSTVGQAPVVDLGGGRLVFALLSGQPFFRYALFVIVKTALEYPEIESSLKLEPLERDNLVKLFRAAQEAEPKIVLRPHDYPEFVTFDDIANPQTVNQIFPDSADAILGQGYGSRRVTITVVSRHEPVSSGFEQRFPAISNAIGRLRPRSKEAPPHRGQEYRLVSRDFVQRS